MHTRIHAHMKDMQTSMQAFIHTNRQTDRQINIHACMNTYNMNLHLSM